MRRLLLPLIVMSLAVSVPCSAQCQEPFRAVTRNFAQDAGNVFGCPTSGNTGSAPCGIRYRFYTDDPSGNGAINPNLDGNPIYVSQGGGSYQTDTGNTFNLFGGTHACGPPLYNVWDAELDGGLGSHRGYYGAQTQRVELDETGNIFFDCAGTSPLLSCFAALGGGEALSIPDTPLGTLLPLGGMAPIPVPLLDTQGCDDVTLAWVQAANWIRTPALGGDPGDGPNPILGVNVFLYESTSVLDPLSVTDADLDAGARFVRFVPEHQTSATLTISTEITPGTVSFLAAIRIVYLSNTGGGAMESIHWSANGDVVLVDDCDGDGVPNPSDNCVFAMNADQADQDGDTLGDACDNCPDRRNLGQGDLDLDGEGDLCDVDDGVLFFRVISPGRVRWQADPAFGVYNLYRGCIEEMRADQEYTQQPGTNPYAARFCDLGDNFLDDALDPVPGEGYFWLVNGEGLTGESALGDGSGVERFNRRPCP